MRRLSQSWCPDGPGSSGRPEGHPLDLTLTTNGSLLRKHARALASAGLQRVTVSLDARKRPVANQYEVVTKYKVTSKNKVNGDVLFMLELEYGSTFHIEGVGEEQMHPFLLIECPRLMFPFVRRIISDVTRDGGFPPLNVDTVDFMALYRQELARRAQAQAVGRASAAG